MKICSTTNCGGNLLAKGMCTKCYYRVKRGGTPELSKKQQQALRLCSIPGCLKSYCSNGYCAMHNKRNKFFGDPLFVNPKCNREPGNKWTKEKAYANTSRWKRENKKEYNAYLARQKKLTRQATPKWLDTKLLSEVYKNCPDGDQVDHIIPIVNDLVCGLNVPWNLQYLSAFDNNSKNNKFDGTYQNESWRKKLKSTG